MIVKKILDKNNIHYSMQKKKNICIYEFDDETLLITISNTKNSFSISRKDFLKIDEKLLPYDFCLENISTNALYYIRIKEPNNFLRNAFDNTQKDEIYFGKEILQNRINTDTLLDNIKSIGEY